MPQNSAFGGRLIYLSEAKLLTLARELGLRVRWKQNEKDDREVSISASPVGVGLGTRFTHSTERYNPLAKEEQLDALLGRVLKKLGQHIPSLDESPEAVLPWKLFHFRRRLRFGIAECDSDRSVKGLVLVDQDPVPSDSGCAGMLLAGAPCHLVHPFRPEGIMDASGSRTGSGTDFIFKSLLQNNRPSELGMYEQSDIDQNPSFASGRPVDRGSTYLAMYSLFARRGWMADPGFPQLLNEAECVGIADAYYVIKDDGRIVVMGSPLFVRVSLPKVE